MISPICSSWAVSSANVSPRTTVMVIIFDYAFDLQLRITSVFSTSLCMTYKHLKHNVSKPKITLFPVLLTQWLLHCVLCVDGISCLEIRCPSFHLCLPPDRLLPIYFIISFCFCLLVAPDSYLFCFLSWARSLVLPQVTAEFPLPYLCVTVYTGKACLGHFLGRCVHLLGWSGE